MVTTKCFSRYKLVSVITYKFQIRLFKILNARTDVAIQTSNCSTRLALKVIGMGKSLTHLISIKGLKYLPCYTERQWQTSKLFFCSGKYFRTDLPVGIPDSKFCSVWLHVLSLHKQRVSGTLSILLHRASCRFTNHHTTNKCTNCMSFSLNHFFKTLSLLLHVSIAYRLSSSGSTYSS